MRGYVDTRQAMMWTGRDKWCLYKWRREGRVRTAKDGRAVLWLWADIVDYRLNADGTLPKPPPKKS